MGYKDLVIGRTPLAYWRFGESSGTVAKDEMGRQNATYVNSPLLSQTAPTNVGDSDTCVKSYGTEDVNDGHYVNIPYNSSFYGLSTMVVDLWVKFTDWESSGNVILQNSGDSYVDSWSRTFLLAATASGFYCYMNGDYNQIHCISTATVELDTWYHVVVVYKKQWAYLYINDKMAAKSNAALDRVTTVNPLSRSIMTSMNWDSRKYSHLNGYIDELAIYDYDWYTPDPSPLTINFTATPVIGASPLAIEFAAIVKTRGAYEVYEYDWCFDYDNKSSEIVSTSSPTITHVYTGYYGQTYSVKLSVKARPAS